MPAFDPTASEFVPRFGAAAFVPSTPPAALSESWEQEEEKVVACKVEVDAADQLASMDLTGSIIEEVMPQADDELIEEEEEEEVITESVFHDHRENVNVVFIGHVDAGKSTISGNLLVLTGQIDPRTVQKYERLAKENNRESWFLAYIMDENDEERVRGKTMEMGKGQFETAAKRYTILDTPGHKTLVPNMIMGTAQADVGVLVISARKGEFETGFDRGGQTREHALLAKTLGVERLVVVINKMDDPSVKWSEERYNEILEKLTPFLRRCGFQLKKSLWFMPCSGMTGANLITPVKKAVCPWWNEGSSLITLIDSMPSSGRDPNAAVRIPVSGRYKEMGCIYIMGKVEVGSLSLKSRLCLMPGAKRFELVGIQTDDTEIQYCRPGENIVLKCRGLEEDDVHTGQVICPVKAPCPITSEFEVQMQVTELLEHKPLITAGYQAVLHIHSVIVECQVVRLLHEFDAQGRKRKRPPVFVKSNAILTCILSTEYPIAIEMFADRPQLGRLTLRDEGKTIAIGKVLRIARPFSG